MGGPIWKPVRMCLLRVKTDYLSKMVMNEIFITKLKDIFRPSYYIYRRIEAACKNILFKSKITDPFSIPIIINNRNRLTTLKQLVAALESRGYRNIFILDNHSSYPPLLDYYRKSPYTIFRLKENLGFLSIWKSGIYKKFYKDFYVYTDSDVVPIDECPIDFMALFKEALVKYPDVQKAGFSLKLDDLPDFYADKESVLEWEAQYFTPSEDDRFYLANIDTTFALYRPGAKGGSSKLKMFRSKYPYEARHMPWYVDSLNMSDEELYYRRTAQTSTHWSNK